MRTEAFRSRPLGPQWPRARFVSIGVCALLAVALAGCGGKQEASGSGAGGCEAGSGQITIATGNATGVYYVLGGGLAKVISDNTDLRATAAETGASVQNIQQLVGGDYDIAFSLADTAAAAAEGKDPFDSEQPIRALARIYPNYTHVIVRKSSGITSMATMKGKRISTGSPKSGTEVIAGRLLKAAGLDPAKDVQAQRLDLTKTVDGMKDGSIDGLVWSGGLPTPAVTDLFTSIGKDVAFVDIAGLLPEMQKVSPVYEAGSLPAAVYKMPADVPTILVPNYLLVTEDFPESNACAITRLLFDKQADLAKVHPSAKDISLDTAAKTDPVKLHDGAKKALDELG
jgi:TRAP transporter TAXI family solute receptor